MSGEPQSMRERQYLARFGLRTLQALAAVTVIVAGATCAAWWFTEGRYIESTDNAYVQGDIARAQPAHRGRRGRHQGGRQPARPCRRSADRAGSGRLARPRLAQATAAAAEATAAVETAQRQVAQQQATIDAAQAAIVQAQAEQARASADATRSGSLVAAAGPRARPTTRRSPTPRKAECRRWPRAQAQKAAAEQQLAGAAGAGRAGRGAPAERRRGGAAGREQPRLHRDPRAVRRHRRQPRGRTRPACDAGHPAHRRRAAAASNSTSSPTSRRPSFAACSRA